MKKKTYVLMVSEKFPLHHPRAGEPTLFEKKILSGEKHQTIRRNWNAWTKREKEINEGRAILSIRKWTGIPYRSKHKEIAQFKSIHVVRQGFPSMDSVPDFYIPTLKKIASLDGLSFQDFKDWVRGSEKIFDAIIYF